LLHLFCPRTLNFDLQGKKMLSRILNKTFYLQFCMRTPKGHQKSSTSKVKKKPKTHMWSIRQRNREKIIETPNLQIETKNFSKKEWISKMLKKICNFGFLCWRFKNFCRNNFLKKNQNGGTIEDGVSLLSWSWKYFLKILSFT
jgi:hypothetical protein